MAKKEYAGTGRRKTSVAQVRLTPGKGKITINGKDVKEYLPFETLIMDLKQPLETLEVTDKFDVTAVVRGGGFSGQTGAIRLGITRALIEYDSESKKALKAKGLVTRDSRKKERKKPGLKKARRAPQFSKR